MNKRPWNQLLLVIAGILMFVGLTPALLFFGREVFVPTDIRSLPLTPSQGGYMSPWITTYGDSEEDYFYATLNQVPGVQSTEEPLEVEEELDVRSITGKELVHEVHRVRVIPGERVALRSPSINRSYLLSRLRVVLKVLHENEQYSGAIPRLELGRGRDSEGTLIEMAFAVIWAVVVAGLGAILLVVLTIVRARRQKCGDTSAARGGSEGRQLWSKPLTTIVCCMIIAGIVPVLLYCLRAVGTRDEVFTLPLTLQNGEYTSASFRVGGYTAYDVTVIPNSSLQTGIKSGAQDMSAQNGPDVQDSLGLEYEIVRNWGADPILRSGYKYPIEYGQKAHIVRFTDSRCLSRVRVVLRFLQKGKSYSDVHPQLVIVPEVGNARGSQAGFVLTWSFLCAVSAFLIQFVVRFW
jgi:hypothetical protein